MAASLAAANVNINAYYYPAKGQQLNIFSDMKELTNAQVHFLTHFLEIQPCKCYTVGL